MDIMRNIAEFGRTSIFPYISPILVLVATSTRIIYEHKSVMVINHFPILFLEDNSEDTT